MANTETPLIRQLIQQQCKESDCEGKCKRVAGPLNPTPDQDQTWVHETIMPPPS